MNARWILQDANGKTAASFFSYSEAIDFWKKTPGVSLRIYFIGSSKVDAIRSMLVSMPNASNQEIKARLLGASVYVGENYIRSVRSQMGLNLGTRQSKPQALSLPPAPEQRLEHAEETIKRRRQPIRRVIKTTMAAAKMVDLETAKDLLTSAGSLEAAITALQIVNKLKK